MATRISNKSVKDRKIPLSQLLGTSEKRWTAFRRGADILEAAATIKRMRLAAGLSQTDLALACDTTQSHISELENGTGKQGPTYGLLKRIARACDLDLSLHVVPAEVAKSPRSVIGARPLHDRVMVRRIEGDQKTAGGIIIPDTAQEKPMEGEVVAVGPGARGEDGKLYPLEVKTGDRVLFGKFSGTEVKIDGDEMLIMKESDIMGILKKEGDTTEVEDATIEAAVA